MGKREKKPNRRRHKGEFSNDGGEDFYDQHPPAAASVEEDEENSEEEEENEGNDELQSSDLPSKFLLYQQSVQVIFNSRLSCFAVLDSDITFCGFLLVL